MANDMPVPLGAWKRRSNAAEVGQDRLPMSSYSTSDYHSIPFQEHLPLEKRLRFSFQLGANYHFPTTTEFPGLIQSRNRLSSDLTESYVQHFFR